VEIKQHSPFGDKLKIRRRAFLPCLKARGFQPEDFDEVKASMNLGVAGVLAVEAKNKLTVTWGQLKSTF
jgi:hypothetical protein